MPKDDLGFAATPTLSEFSLDPLSLMAFALIRRDHFSGRPDHLQLAFFQPRAGFAQLFHLRQSMTDEDDGATLAAELLDALGALALKALVADRQHLVDQQHFGLHVRRHGESEPNEHSRRIVLHRSVDEVLQSGELDDVVELRGDLFFGQPENRAVHEHVLAAG
jgi:hypothetical protein